jgi:hypothetical protein
MLKITSTVLDAGDQLLNAFNRPPLLIAGSVNHREYMYQIISCGKENAIRKSGQQGTPNTRQNLCVQKRHLLKAL